jgi:hypothetical protein
MIKIEYEFAKMPNANQNAKGTLELCKIEYRLPCKRYLFAALYSAYYYVPT